ncbi:MAG: D-cysteine desulfhydrase family protein [Myxococcota bacterium]
MADVLDAFPRIRLAHLPTPLEPLPRLTEALGGPEIWIKRDDCTGLATGGNKARKLEFLLGAARADEVDTVITLGGVQSNHARQTAAAAARTGLRCQLVLPRVVPRSGTDYERNGNVLLDRLLGAEVFVEADEPAALRRVEVLLREAAEAGRRAVVHPPGGSTAVGALGYVNAALELAEQMRGGAPVFARAYLGVGTAGTLAGLAAGAPLADWAVELVGVCVSGGRDKHAPQAEQLLADLAPLLGAAAKARAPIRFEEGFLGEGYGIPAPSTIEAIRLCAETEGLLLDPVYTGKAMAALIDDVRSGRAGAEPILFWHTGGSPGLYAYRAEMESALG